MTLDKGFQAAISAVRILGAEPAEVARVCASAPAIIGEFHFPRHRDARYLYGVACVYRTYLNAIFDCGPDEADAPNKRLYEYLNHMMHLAPPSDWNLVAVASSTRWTELRNLAADLLAELHDLTPPTAIDVGALISLDEFFTPRSVRRILKGL